MREAHLSLGAEEGSGQERGRRGIEWVAWCFALRGAALAVARATAVAAKDFWAASRPKTLGV